MARRRALLAFPLALLATAAGAETIPLARAFAIAEDRYRGRALDGTIVRGRKHEPDLVYVITFRTDAGDILRIRIDAETGAFLEVAGRGQAEALRR